VLNPNSAVAAIMILVSGLISIRAAEPAKPLQVFILAGQTNMEGQSVADLEGKD